MWLILEDSINRASAFQEAASGFFPPQTLKLWRIAQQMIKELPLFFDHATIISLDHDLYRHEPHDPEPGTGREVANYLATLQPVCPVIIHSTNTDAAWGMCNELTHSKWQADLIHHLDEPQWIQQKWAALVQQLLANKQAQTK